jgi:DNA-binding SARP family transcriptional activator
VRELRLIGPFQVRRDGVQLALPHSAERLLAAVALVGPLSRGHVRALLWPDVEPVRAAANLRAALSRLSSTDPGLLQVVRNVMSVRDDVRVDVDQAMDWIHATIYGSATQEGAPPRTSGRDLLPGWDEEWLFDPRERLRVLQAQALETAAERLMAAGRLAEALPYALGAVQAQPWSESANRLVIEIHAQRGDTSNALRRFQRFRRTLEAELGVQPRPDLVAAMRQMFPSGPLFERTTERSRARRGGTGRARTPG